MYFFFVDPCVCCELSLELSCLPRASRLVIFCLLPRSLLYVVSEASRRAVALLRSIFWGPRNSSSVQLGGVSIKILFAFRLGADDVPTKAISVL